ncbi:MAG: hypothetical protein AB1512_15510 [Thermodesulfobacteriota bacterium]
MKLPNDWKAIVILNLVSTAIWVTLGKVTDSAPKWWQSMVSSGILNPYFMLFFISVNVLTIFILIWLRNRTKPAIPFLKSETDSNRMPLLQDTPMSKEEKAKIRALEIDSIILQVKDIDSRLSQMTATDYLSGIPSVEPEPMRLKKKRKELITQLEKLGQ